MRPNRPFHPSLGDRLEDRLVLSASAALLGPALILPSLHAQHHLFLTGIIEGTSRTEFPPIPDVGTSVVLKGSGRIRPLGNVSAGGSLHEAGFILIGRDEGALTLSNTRGSVSIRFSRPFSAQGGGHSGPYHFVIVGGTGAYKGATGSGKAELEFGGPIVSGSGIATGLPMTGGSFVMGLNASLKNVALPPAILAGPLG